MSTARQIASDWGMANVEAAVAASAQVGLRFEVACALLEMESRGKNIYGHDSGGIFANEATRNVVVTEENYTEFRRRLAEGEKSNGVGPCQITWPGYFPIADARDLQLWRPLDNMIFGFQILADHYAKSKSWESAGTAYNGKSSYGVTFARRVLEWTERLATTTEEEAVGLYPGAVKKLIKPGVNDPEIKVVGAILHVDAGNVQSLYNYFNGPSGGIESHFHIRKDGVVEQYRDTGWEADANLKANSFVEGGVRKGFVSIETQGHEKGEWNGRQMAEIKKLLTWLSETHDFPLRKCPGPFKSGVGYHILFGAPGPWTPVAKSCPGPDRIKQFNDVIIPWMKDGSTSPTQEEKDMALSKDDIDSIWNADLIPRTKMDDYKTPENENNPNWRPLSILSELDRSNRRLEAKVDKLIAALATLADDGK